MKLLLRNRDCFAPFAEAQQVYYNTEGSQYALTQSLALGQIATNHYNQQKQKQNAEWEKMNNAEIARAKAMAEAATPKLPWDSWLNYPKVTANGQKYADVGGRLYSQHAVNRMQPSGNRFGSNIYQGINGADYGRSIAPQYVEDVLNSVLPTYQARTGNYIYTSGNVQVVVNSDGAIVTIGTYIK